MFDLILRGFFSRNLRSWARPHSSQANWSPLWHHQNCLKNMYHGWTQGGLYMLQINQVLDLSWKHTSHLQFQSVRNFPRSCYRSPRIKWQLPWSLLCTLQWIPTYFLSPTQFQCLACSTSRKQALFGGFYSSSSRLWWGRGSRRGCPITSGFQDPLPATITASTYSLGSLSLPLSRGKQQSCHKDVQAIPWRSLLKNCSSQPMANIQVFRWLTSTNPFLPSYKTLG